MYVFIIAILFGIGTFFILFGQMLNSKVRVWFGRAVVACTVLFFSYLSIWGEYLWFESLGYASRFNTVFLSILGFAIIGFLVSVFFTHSLTSNLKSEKINLSKYLDLSTGLFGAIWGAFNWDTYLLFLNRTKTNLIEPLFGLDTGFYLFSLPLMTNIFQLLLLLVSFSLIWLTLKREDDLINLSSLNRCIGILFFILSYGSIISAFNLVYSNFGSVRGAGWTDINIRLPIYYILAIIFVVSGIVLLVPLIRNRVKNWLSNTFQLYNSAKKRLRLNIAIVMPIALVVVWTISTNGIPMLIQWLIVEPNEITFEKPYIERNIKFTRHGFNIDKAQEHEFVPSTKLSQDLITRNQEVLNEVRLWDWNALTDVYDQFQEIRLYYEFPDVDIDRYKIDGKYRQVMVSPREMEIAKIPQKSKTFINKRFKYTHGYGITMAPVSDFTEEGLPKLVIQNIPPKSTSPELLVKRPEIYYGQLTREHVFTNTKEKEFDYPSGDKNIYTKYQGTGGVSISSFWRKFLFGWKFDGTRLLLSTYPTNESRVLFHRQIKNRVQTLAPFLKYDSDPYIVLSKGRLHWIIDAYTTSETYPYSQPFLINGYIEKFRGQLQHKVLSSHAKNLINKNYIRNSVKVVLDAYNGKVDFYIFDHLDPIINVWKSALPNFFKNKESMPKDLLAHVRYPVELLAAQGMMYAKYHMTDPEVFYNQEDLWVRATEKYYSSLRPVSPYYVMWKPPGSTAPEFSLIQPFTPKNRQLMIGWLAGLSDGDNYGKLLVYRFPKESRVLGPQQVETKIDQDPYLSSQLTLWDQRGSRVIRGNILAIPVEDSLLYFEPIYLQAETAAYPELRLVVAMYGDKLSYGKSLEEAISGLLDKPDHKQIKPFSLTLLLSETDKSSSKENRALAKKAVKHLDSYLRLNYEKKFVEAAKELNKLNEILNNTLEEVAQKEKLETSTRQ
jgi:uncharacterized membrane protein (UPF0182 family)